MASTNGQNNSALQPAIVLNGNIRDYFDSHIDQRMADLQIDNSHSAIPDTSSEESDSDPTDSDGSDDYYYEGESDNTAFISEDDDEETDSDIAKSDNEINKLFLSGAEEEQLKKKEQEQQQEKRESNKLIPGTAKTGPILRPVKKRNDTLAILKALEQEEARHGGGNKGRGRRRTKYDEEEEEEEDEDDKAKRSLLSDNTARNRSGRRKSDYASYKRRIIHPYTAFDLANSDSLAEIPYTSDNEEARDARRAAELKMEISQIYSNTMTRRMYRTLERGSLDDADLDSMKTYLVASDLSPEATHALEWTIGTVLRDGSLLVVVCCFDEDTKFSDNTAPNTSSGSNGTNDEATHAANRGSNSNASNSNHNTSAGSASNKDRLSSESSTATSPEEQLRLRAIEKLTQQTEKLLAKTRLQVRVVFEVLHCKNARHMITEIIDHVSPTLVIVGSRGRSALKGVLLGSFSNYVVERSSVPVMVARQKLQKAKNRDLNVRLANNLRVHGLANARID